MLRHIMNNELHFSKAEFILGSHQMKPCINITFMIAKSHIFSCKMREYRPSINVFKNKLIHWLLAEKYNSKKNSSFQKSITIWRDFLILLAENPTPTYIRSTWIWASHRLRSSVSFLCIICMLCCCFCVHLLFYFIFSIIINCLCGFFANPPIVKFMCIFQLLRKYNL